MSHGLAIGRLLVALIFVRSGAHKWFDLPGTADSIAGKGLPLALAGAVLAAGVELFGGLALALGWKMRAAALVLFVFLVPVTMLYHAPTDPRQQGAFFKNLAIMGGLLVTASWRQSAGNGPAAQHDVPGVKDRELAG